MQFNSMLWSESGVGAILAAVLNVLTGLSSSNFEVLCFHYNLANLEELVRGTANDMSLIL